MGHNKATDIEFYQANQPDRVKGDMEEIPSSSNKIAESSLLALPPEIRNMIYPIVIADIPGIPGWRSCAVVGEFSLCQPALAKVNRQLRYEILPIWYSGKSFGIRIYPKTHEEADRVWQGFLDRFNALGAGANGSSYLSYIQRLDVELWHPAFVDYFLPRGLFLPHGLGNLSKDIRDEYMTTGQYPLAACNGVYLQFGPVTNPRPHRVGDDDTEWTDRGAVRALLRAALVDERIYHRRRPNKLETFWETFPVDRLVDLVIMIAAECKGPARLVRIGSSFSPR